MTFSIGGGPKRPPRPPTHKALDVARLARHAADLDEIAEDGMVSAEAIDDLAFERGVDVQELYAALAISELVIRREHEVRFEVCAGGCQEWGALDVIGHLLEARAERIDDGAPAWDVVPRPCLDQCRHAAAVIAAGPAGHALIPEATSEKLDEAIAELVDSAE